MPEPTSRTVDVENLLDSVEYLCEAVREAQRKKATLKAQEKLVGELAGETRELLAVLEAPPTPAAVAATGNPRKSLPGRILMPVEILGIRQARHKLALSQNDLAKKVGVSAPTICLIENARQAPSSDLLDRIFEVLGLERTP
jgi:DNA-binding XRE family transcriptional regulator